eukprot:2761515-Heterocapsa_arctica.AAC.1
MADGTEAPNNYCVIMMNISTIKGDTKYGYIFYQALGNFTYARWLDRTKAMKRRSYLNDGKKPT